MGLISGSGRSPGAENGNLPQYSCLENSTDGGAWQTTVHGSAKSHPWLSNWLFMSMCTHTHTHTMSTVLKTFGMLAYLTMWPGDSMQNVLLLFSHSVVSDCLRLHGLQHIRFPCFSLTPRVCSNSCPLSLWCWPTISSSIVPFSPCLQSFPASGSFPMNWSLASGGQSFGSSTLTSVLAINIQDWFTLGLIDLMSLQSKGVSRVFSNTTAQKHQMYNRDFKWNIIN